MRLWSMLDTLRCGRRAGKSSKGHESVHIDADTAGTATTATGGDLSPDTTLKRLEEKGSKTMNDQPPTLPGQPPTDPEPVRPPSEPYPSEPPPNRPPDPTEPVDPARPPDPTEPMPPTPYPPDPFMPPDPPVH